MRFRSCLTHAHNLRDKITVEAPPQTIQLISQLLDAKAAFKDILSGEVLKDDPEWLLLGLLDYRK